MNDCSKSKVVHLLFKGEQSSRYNSTIDEYVIEFNKRDLIAATIPVLEFNFINLELLGQYLKRFTEESDFSGLVITSPRVVDALKKALGLSSEDEQVEIVSKINPDLLFIVGSKSASKCETKLGIKCNNKSPECGNGLSLAEYIKKFCSSYHKTTTAAFSLLYPKGNLSDSMIDDSLGNVDKLKINSLVVYETSTRNDIGNTVTSTIEELNIKSEALTLNLIFFSPSGVEGFMKIDRERLIIQLQLITTAKSIDILYSSIGKTTEIALSRNSVPVFSVAPEPNPTSLVDAIQKAFLKHLDKS